MALGAAAVLAPIVAARMKRRIGIRSMNMLAFDEWHRPKTRAWLIVIAAAGIRIRRKAELTL